MPDATDLFVARLQARALRAFARAEDITTTLAAFRGVVGPRVDELDPAARKAHALLRERALPSPDEIAALEYAIRLLRPAPLVRDGTLTADVPFRLWPAFRDGARALTPAVARLERLESDGFGRLRATALGTGFLVSPKRLLTNRHVLAELTNGAEVIGPRMVQATFRFEYGSTVREPPVAIAGVAAIHPELDLALLALEREPEPARAPLAFEATAAHEADPVVAIGYPGDDTDNPVFASQLFGDRFGVLRASPGEVLEVKVSELHHDCTTLRGSSGSPVLSMASGRVVGVHSSGRYLFRNAAVVAASATQFLSEAA